MRARYSGMVLLLSALALPVAGAAHAGDSGAAADADDGRARELFMQGDRAYAEGDYETALEAFEQAYALSGRHALLYNMANAHERLAEYDKALDKLRKFLPHASSGQQKLIEKRMRSLQMRLDAQRAEEAEKPREPKEEREPEATEQEPDKEESGAKVTVDGEPPPPYLGYALVGVGALGLGLGTYFGMQALDARSEAEDGCPDVDGARRCTTDARDAIDRDKSNSLLADVSLGAGIASAAVGVWLILSHDGTTRETDTATRVTASPRAGGGQVDVVLRF